MPLVCAIYGYEFTRPFSACGAHFIPRYTSYSDARDAARDKSRYRLTGTIHAPDFPGDMLFRLEAILSFVEHLDVVITEPRDFPSPEAHDFPEVLVDRRRHDGGGAILSSDAFFRASRPLFVARAFALLGDVEHCQKTGYRTLFFKTSETFRQRKPFLEVSYFLLFSGLETYVRKSLGDFASRDVAQLLARRLRALGFNVFNFKANELARSMDTYARLRNALFHNSEFQAHRTVNGALTEYRIEDFYAQFLILVALVVLKATDFDDGHTNWDAWIDRQLFK